VLVDLAGSERLKETKHSERVALRETGAINKSLFTLGQVGGREQQRHARTLSAISLAAGSTARMHQYTCIFCHPLAPATQHTSTSPQAHAGTCRHMQAHAGTWHLSTSVLVRF
jgi:hypothetical protein